jgi:hypothetical protein
MLGPFPVESVLSRIASIKTVRVIGSAVDLDAALNTPPKNVPAVFVLCEEQGQTPANATGLPSQPVAVTLKLVMWVKHAGGAQKSVAAMGELERALRTSLFGWRPVEAIRPMTVALSGNEQAFGDHLVRQLLMTTRYTQTTEVTP